MAAGNRSVLVVLDSRCKADRVSAERTVFAALEHFGVCCEVLECADYMAPPPGHCADRAAYVLAHDGAGAGLKDACAADIAEAVRHGAGLLSFDRDLADWPAPLRALAPDEVGQATVESLRILAAGFLTFGHDPDEVVELDSPLRVTTTADSAWQPLVGTADGTPVVVRAAQGEGRVVLFGSGERLYADEVYGHVRGLDGLFWRSLVWVAAKPFPMRCVPPLVSARMDDCHGTHNAFGYVEAMNRHGISPNLGLFIDELGPTDWAAVRRLYETGGADFSMHAFRDDFYRARANWKPYAVLADKPDLSLGGREPKFEGLSLDHVTGRDLPSATVRDNFRRLDEAFARAGIRHSRVINAHYGEIGWRAVPRFLERGADLPCNNSVVGQLYGNQPAWRPRPYASRGVSGRHGLVIDRCRHGSGLTFISMTPAVVGKTHMTGDILSGRVPFLGESDVPRLDDAAARGIANVKLGLDALAFGVIMTHEERIDVISLDDWTQVIDTIVRGLDDWDTEYTGRERTGVICQRLLDSRLVYTHLDAGRLHCELSGLTDGPSPLTIWTNDGDECRRRTVDVPEIEGFGEVSI